MTRAQRIIRNMSFESDAFDIYSPKYSSDGGIDSDDDHLFADEEAEGKICDERLSELNPCDGDSFIISDVDNDSKSSNKTELERCPIWNQDSENLQDDDIRESLTVKHLF